MQKKRVFISSVQSEFVEERQMLFEYLTTDALLGKFFEPFVFENMPALAVAPETVFLQEVENMSISIWDFSGKIMVMKTAKVFRQQKENLIAPCNFTKLNLFI